MTADQPSVPIQKFASSRRDAGACLAVPGARLHTGRTWAGAGCRQARSGALELLANF